MSFRGSVTGRNKNNYAFICTCETLNSQTNLLIFSTPGIEPTPMRFGSYYVVRGTRIDMMQFMQVLS